MKTRLYSFKTLDVPKLINMLTDEGHTIRIISKATGLGNNTITRWRHGHHRPYNRALCDKLVDYAVRNLIDSELEDCEIYP